MDLMLMDWNLIRNFITPPFVAAAFNFEGFLVLEW